MSSTTKEEILATRTRLKREDVPTPEMGEGKTITVRELLASEREAYEQGLVTVELSTDAEGETRAKTKAVQSDNTKARLVVLGIIDPDTGLRMFADGEARDVGEMSSVVVQRLYDVIRRLSGMDRKGRAAIEKNSETGAAASSSLTSPVTSK